MKRFTFLFLLLTLFCSPIFAQQQSRIQAIFVLKFVENVSWPNANQKLILGVVGNNEVHAEIENRLKVKNPLGIEVKSISASDAALCDVIYVPSTEDGAMGSITSLTKDKSILLITESDFSRKGSCISFIEEAGRMHFIINKNTIDGKGLKISTALLTLGKQV